MIFFYIFLAVVIVGSFALGIFITVMSKNSETSNNTSVSPELKEMMQSHNLSKSSIDLINKEEDKIKENEDNDDEQVAFTARRSEVSESDDTEEELI